MAAVAHLSGNKSKVRSKLAFPAPRRRRTANPAAMRALSETLESRCLLSVSYTNTTVANFTTDNLTPNGPLVFQEGTGNLFGVSEMGGGDGGIGTVFEIPATGNGTITTLDSLGDLGAATPLGGLIASANGTMYGVSQGGGTGAGAIFSVGAGGTGFGSIGVFDDSGIDNDANPAGPLLIVNGSLFGVSAAGGLNNAGEVFELPIGGGAITDLAPFPAPSGQPSHADPGLVVDPSGNVYGILTQTGTNGSVFEVLGNSITTVASFAPGDNAFVAGTQESAPLVESQGNLFGIDAGGAFEIAAGSHTITQLGNTSGLSGQPESQLIIDSSGDLFGTTTNGVFEWVKSTQSFTMIATLPSSVNGLPDGVVFGDNGDIFVTDGGGGTSSDGAVYELIPNGSPTPTPSSLTPAISGKLPASVIAGQKAAISQTVAITASGAAYDAAATTKLYLSTSTAVDDSAIALPAQLSKTLKLKTGAHVSFKLSLKSLPASVPDGTYHVLAQVTDNAGATSVAASSATITVAPPQIDLSVSIAKFASTAKGGKKFTETIHVANAGNIAAVGSLPIVVDTSPDGLLGDATQLGTETKGINIKPGKSIMIPVSLTAPASGSSAFLIFQIDPDNKFDDINLANNVIVSTSEVTFS